MCKWRQWQKRIWSKKGRKAENICTQTTVDNILNKQALETSYSSNTPFMSKEMWTNNDLASALLMVSGEWPVASIANTELRGV